QETQNLLDQAERLDGFAVLAVRVPAADVDTMRQMTDWFRDKLGSSVVVLGAVINDKPMLIATVTQDLIARGLHAGNLVRDTAKVIGGGGGGRPNMAQAGGKDSDKLPAALAGVLELVQANVR
ncbi:MAG: alanine--tRNA ligase, partial [Caldilineaceae bacterium]|nr:alanine--tRNA ligase [Caldilineaceae bacterium]